MVQIFPRRRGETPAHLSLKDMAVAWAREQGFGIAKKEVPSPTGNSVSMPRPGACS
jgi:hypothetical protein